MVVVYKIIKIYKSIVSGENPSKNFYCSLSSSGKCKKVFNLILHFTGNVKWKNGPRLIETQTPEVRTIILPFYRNKPIVQAVN